MVNSPRLGAPLAVEDDLEQQVAQLLGEVLGSSSSMASQDLVGFLDQVGLE